MELGKFMFTCVLAGIIGVGIWTVDLVITNHVDEARNIGLGVLIVLGILALHYVLWHLGPKDRR